MGAGDVDDDARIEGGTIISRLYLEPFDMGTGNGSFAAVGLEAAATNLRLGAALGILQIGATGGTTTALELAARGALVDPDSSGKIFLNELLNNPAGAVDVGFGTFAGADLSGAFNGFSAGDTIGSFELALEIVNADTYGIDLGGELASVPIDVEVESVVGLIPTLDVDVDINTAALPNFSDILSSFQNLSIPQIISLVADLVVQFQDFPLFQLELPLLDQSIGDLVEFVSDKVDDLLGDFSTLRTDLESLLQNTINALQTQSTTLIIGGQSLSSGLAAIGAERQQRLFDTLEDVVAAIQTIPADFDIRFDAGQAQLVNLAGAIRALQEIIGEIRDDVVPGAPAASAVADFFTTTIASVPALSTKSFVGLVSNTIPSGDRVVQLVMNALGLDLFDLSDAANAAILTAVTTARNAVTTALGSLPELPSDGDLGGDAGLILVRDAAQAALDDAVSSLNKVFDRLELAVNEQDVFAALRSVQYLTDAISELNTAAQTLIDNGDVLFDTAISDLSAFVNSIISDVRDNVFQAFPFGALTFSTEIPGAVLFNLHIAKEIPSLTVDVEFDLDDAGLPAIIPLDVNAGVTGSLDLAADFMFGFGLDVDPGSGTFLQPFLDRASEISLTASVDLAVSGTAGIGGFTIDIVDGIVKLSDMIDLGGDGVGGNPDDFGGPAKLGLGLSDPDGSDKGIFFSEIGLSIFDPILEATALVNLPIEAGGSSLGEIFALVSITDFTDFDVQISGLDADLIDEILNGLTELSLENIIAGMRFVFDTIVDGLESDLIGQLPLIGDDLQAIGDFLDELDVKFLTPVETFITDTLAGAAADILEQLQMVVFDTLGPGLTSGDIFSFTPLDFLILDENYDGVAGLTFEDVPIVFTGSDISDPLALTFPDAGYEFDLTFGFDEMFSLPLDFSLGGLGLGIEGNPTIDVNFAPTFDVSFGLDRLQGFYVNLDVPGDPIDVGVGETAVSVGLDVLLDPASMLTLKLFFLELTAEVAPGGSVGFSASADVGFGTGQLTFSSLENFSPSFSFMATADADLLFTASLAGQQSLPSVTAGLDVDWDFTLDQDGISNTIDVSYNDIAIDLGDFFRDNIAPVIDTVNQFLQPLNEIFDVVQSEIPVISDLSELLGQGPVTFLDLVSLLGSGFTEVGQFLDTLAAISDIVDTLGDIAMDLGTGVIEFGDLALGDTIDFSNVRSRSQVRSFDDAGALSKTAADIASQLGSAASKIDDLKMGSFSSSVGVTNGAFHFPVVEDPFGTVAGFLLGQTSDLVVWDLPSFVAEFGFKQLFGPIFPPIPLFVSIFGNFRFATDFAVGFDTRGIQQSFADFYKGFYFRDWVAGDNGVLDAGETTEARELGLDLEFGAGAELNVVVASAGVEGGIKAGITADWNDVLEDGKFYIDEVGQRLSQGLECIFDLSGALDAFLRAFVKIGFDTPFGFVTLFSESLNLVNVTLLDFSLSCPPLPIPQPGSDLVLGSDSPIHLNIGPRAAQRQPGATDIAEIVEVFGERDLDPMTNVQFPAAIVDSDGDNDIDSDDVDAFVGGGGTVPPAIDLNGDNKIDTDEARLIEDFNANGTIGTTLGDKQSILLIGFGQWQLFLNSATGVIGDGGAEDDQILFDHSVQIPGTLRGGPGKDKIQGGQASDVMFGDGGAIGGAAGEDILIGGFGDDEIHGGGLDDQIFGNAGSDDIFGDDGNDTIAGDDGNNVQPVVLQLNGDPVSPTQLVPLSSLNDTVHGGAGEDNIVGEFGNDELHGESGPDQLTGGWGDDMLDGGSEPDLLEGNEGSDTIHGRGGNDLIFGEADGISTDNDGSDFLDGGNDNDTIRDDRGNDTAIGGFGDDFIVTGVDNDVIFGDLDPRVGGVPPAGFNGKDVIFGDRDALPAVADGLGLGNGADYIEGGGNQDTIRGGDGPDRIIGGGSPFSGTTFGGTDAGDQIFGEGGDDIIAGDNARIGTAGDVTSAATVTTFPEGGAGVDLILGAAGADIIFGGGAGDTLNGDDAGGTWNDIVVGDQGTLTATMLEALHSGIAGSGGQDRIQGFGGDDILLGGDDNDTVIGNSGNDVMAGDNATVTFAGGVVVRVETRDEMFGGDDLINGDAGADIAFGGTGNDVISGGGVTDQADILFGDNGVAVLQDGSAEENNLFSTDPTLGGTDTIFGGVGNDIIVGGSGGNDTTGTGGDDLFGQADDDIVVGDNARINRTSGAIPVVEFIKTIFGNAGGDDELFGNAGLDILIGGFGSDQIQGNEDDDIMLGDNGGVYFVDDPETLGEVEGDGVVQTLDLIRSFTDGLGHTDTISGNGGADVAMGGTVGDVIHGDDATASAGAADQGDILLGDNGDVVLLDASSDTGTGTDAITILGGTVATIRTTDATAATGGIDTISGNAGSDIIAGGVLGDTLYGDAVAPGALDGDDVMLGDNGRMEWLYSGDASFAAIETGFVFDTTLTTLDLITTELPVAHPGGRDEMFGDDGKDLMFGGEDTDTMYGDDGDLEAVTTTGSRDVMFGDHGRIYPQHSALIDFPSENFFAIDTGGDDNGEGDRMWGEEGDDVMLGQQGDDRMFGGGDDDDMIGGHNVEGGADEFSVPAPAIVAMLNPPVNDIMDGGSGDDAMAGDNAIIWRRGDDVSPRFRTLTQANIYTTTVDGVDPAITTNIGGASQSDPNNSVGRDIQLLDHSDAVQTTPLGRFGADVMAGGADDDVMFGQLGNDLMQGDGNIGPDDLNDPNFITHEIDVMDSGSIPDMDETLYFNIPQQSSDGGDYMEGNGGKDLMYGGLGQDDMIGGSSALFGLASEDQRPDGSDIIFGGAGAPARLVRNDFVGSTDTDTGVAPNPLFPNVPIGAVPTSDDPSIALADRHSRDADFIMGDNSNVYRLVNGGSDQFLQFNYDATIIPRAMEQLDYTLGGADFHGGEYVNGAADIDGILGPLPADNGDADLIHGESGDDYIFGMTGSDVMFGESDDDDIVGGYGNDWASGGTGQDGVLGDDGLLFTSRNSTLGEPLYGIVGLSANDPSSKYSHGNVLDEVISTPGKIQFATINITGALKKTADLVPFSYDATWLGMDDEFPDNDDNTPFADDVIFGGLDSDFLHGASGDDAISGAEALENAYVPINFDATGTPQGILNLGYNAFILASPINPGDMVANPNPGDVLAFNPVDLDGQHLNNRFRAGEFFLYDEYDPLRKILLTPTGELYKDAGGVEGVDFFQFLLNFDEGEGLFRPEGNVPKPTGQQTETYPAVNDDGRDAVFGDLGNDWLVGGTGRDNTYGGFGNDLLNADDNHSTNANANDVPDTHPTFEDRAYGGAGRDVLIANTGGDRLQDWVGEYNSNLVPFAPFGQATVSRTLQPFLPEFLYALSAGDGADPTRYADAIGGTPPAPTNNSPNPSRNGEPFGELGLVLQRDFAWHDQTGAPADPQAGNIPGGHRDVLRSASFSGPQAAAQGFFVDSGNWSVQNGSYQVEPTVLGGDGLSVFLVDKYVPNYFEILATLNAVKPTGGYKANAFLVFDYHGDRDFKFAGINASTNKLQIGRRTESGWIADVQGSVQGSLKSNKDYNVFVSVNGTAVTMIVDNKFTLTHTFQPRVDELGNVYGLNRGMVGLGADNAKAKIGSIVVQRLAPVFDFNQTVDFSAGTTGLFEPPTSGQWNVANGRYAGTDSAGVPAINLADVSASAAATILMSAALSVTGEGGFVFDRYDADNFKFATISAGKITIGHHTTDGWFIDAAYNSASIVAGSDYAVELTLQGTIVSVTFGGQPVLSHVFNALVTDGGFGLFSRAGTTSFDTVTIQTAEN